MWTWGWSSNFQLSQCCFLSYIFFVWWVIAKREEWRGVNNCRKWASDLNGANPQMQPPGGAQTASEPCYRSWGCLTPHEERSSVCWIRPKGSWSSLALELVRQCVFISASKFNKHEIFLVVSALVMESFRFLSENWSSQWSKANRNNQNVYINKNLAFRGRLSLLVLFINENQKKMITEIFPQKFPFCQK